MNETVSTEPRTGYIGFEQDMTWDGMQFEIGKEVVDTKVEAFRPTGTHYLSFPLDVFAEYAPGGKTRYAKILDTGELSDNDERCGVGQSSCFTTKLTPVEEVTVQQLADASLMERIDAIRMLGREGDILKHIVENIRNDSVALEYEKLNPSVPWTSSQIELPNGSTKIVPCPSTVNRATENMSAVISVVNGVHAMHAGMNGIAGATINNSAAIATSTRGAAVATGGANVAIASGSAGSATTTGGSKSAVALGYNGTSTATGSLSVARARGCRSLAYVGGEQSAAVVTGQGSVAVANDENSVAVANCESGVAVANCSNSKAEARGKSRTVAVATGFRSDAVVEVDRGIGVALVTCMGGSASATGGNAIAISTCYDGSAKASLGGWIVCTEVGLKDEIIGMKCGCVDGVNLLPDTYYVLKNGEFIKEEDLKKAKQ